MSKTFQTEFICMSLMADFTSAKHTIKTFQGNCVKVDKYRLLVRNSEYLTGFYIFRVFMMAYFYVDLRLYLNLVQYVCFVYNVSFRSVSILCTIFLSYNIGEGCKGTWHMSQSWGGVCPTLGKFFRINKHKM